MTTATAVLTAMIAPSVLISYAGTLLLSTSNRLARTTDRVRTLTARCKVLVTDECRAAPLAREEKRLILSQLPRLSRCIRFIQRAMHSLYLAVMLLVLSGSVSGLDDKHGALAGAPCYRRSRGVGDRCHVAEHRI